MTRRIFRPNTGRPAW